MCKEEVNPDDPKMLEFIAKQAFMKVDDRTLKAFREQGRTPTLKSSPYGSEFFSGDYNGKR